MERLISEMLEYLNGQDFDYYKRVFNYDRWQTITKHIIETCYGCSSQGKGYYFNSKGCYLKYYEEEKFINIKDLKRMFEQERSNKQLRLF